MPLWLGGSDDELLNRLPISRIRGGSILPLAEALWQEILDRLGGWPDDSVEADLVERALRSSGGPGFRLEQDLKDAVEDLAMDRAKEWLGGQGWEVDDVHASEPYDLVGRRDDEEIRVEVKGTLTDGTRVLLTPREVEHARCHHTLLFVLRDVQATSDERGRMHVSGGIADVYDPLTIDDFAPRSLGYSYDVTHLPTTLRQATALPDLRLSREPNECGTFVAAAIARRPPAVRRLLLTYTASQTHRCPRSR